MFKNATNFNQPLDSWNVAGVIGVNNIFDTAISFNQPLDNWNVTLGMTGMFRNAINFNQPLKSWNLSYIDNISYMFKNAKSFNQDLSSWKPNIDKIDYKKYALFACGADKYKGKGFYPKAFTQDDLGCIYYATDDNIHNSVNDVFVGNNFKESG